MHFIICLLLIMFGTNFAVIGHAQSSEDLFASLKHPANITVELARNEVGPNEKAEDLNKPFGPKEQLYFRILLTNMSTQSVVIVVSDRYLQNRPKLLKDGLEIPYRQETIPRLLEEKEMERFLSSRTYQARLDPGVQRHLDHLDLGEWYFPLKAGHYQLTNRYRFVPGGDWLESPPITFEINTEKGLKPALRRDNHRKE